MTEATENQTGEDLQGVSEGHISNVISMHVSPISGCFPPPDTYDEGKRIQILQSASVVSLPLGSLSFPAQSTEKICKVDVQLSLFSSSSLHLQAWLKSIMTFTIWLFCTSPNHFFIYSASLRLSRCPVTLNCSSPDLFCTFLNLDQKLEIILQGFTSWLKSFFFFFL